MVKKKQIQHYLKCELFKNLKHGFDRNDLYGELFRIDAFQVVLWYKDPLKSEFLGFRDPLFDTGDRPDLSREAHLFQ